MKEETVTVIPSKLKVWQKVDMLSNPWFGIGHLQNRNSIKSRRKC